MCEDFCCVTTVVKFHEAPLFNSSIAVDPAPVKYTVEKRGLEKFCTEVRITDSEADQTKSKTGIYNCCSNLKKIDHCVLPIFKGVVDGWSNLCECLLLYDSL